MGERWTELRDDLRAAIPDGIEVLRTALVDAGEMLSPMDPDLPTVGFDPSCSRFDAAVVMLLQAAALLERRGFPRRLVLSGIACRDAPRGERDEALGQLAGKVERLLLELACVTRPELREGRTLTDSLNALRKAGLLPLSQPELERWDADQRAVTQLIAERQAKGELSGRRIGKAVALLWNARTRAAFADPDIARSAPRYLALLELQAVRNAHAHALTRNLQGIDVPWVQWRRMTAFTALACARAFALGVLSPPPTLEVGASTISRPPARRRRRPVPAEEPEPLIAHAEVVPSRLRRWLFVTAAATVAVVIGTVAANLVASRVGTPATSSREPVAEVVEASPAPSADPMLALSSPSLASSAPGRRTRLCEALGAGSAAQVLPALAFERVPRAHARVDGPLRVDRMAAMLQADPSLGSVVILAASDSDGQEDVSRHLQRAMCELRPVLTVDEALSGGALVEDAFVVADLGSLVDSKVRRLLDLAEQGRRPRLLLTTTPASVPRLSLAHSVVVVAPFDCVGARAGVARLLGVSESDAQERLAVWNMLPRTGSKPGQVCRPAAALLDLRGLLVVSAALARHGQPPPEHDGTWGSWVLRGAGDPVNGLTVPARELLLRARAGELARGIDVVGVRPMKRQKRCAGWAEGLGQDLADADLLAHIVGTLPGRSCTAWLVSSALEHGLRWEAARQAVDRGLGPDRWRDAALREAQRDVRGSGSGPSERLINALIE